LTAPGRNQTGGGAGTSREPDRTAAGNLPFRYRPNIRQYREQIQKARNPAAITAKEPKPRKATETKAGRKPVRTRKEALSHTETRTDRLQGILENAIILLFHFLHD
jgi:hypothetical protein